MELIYFIILNLVIYMPFHLFEEAAGDFPKWMYTHKWLPYHMTHGHWIANNIFIYYPLLLLAVFLFLINETFACFGTAILVWGIINFADHFFYTIKDRKVSPGLITGILFLVNSISGLSIFIKSGSFSVPGMAAGIITGIILFSLPMGLCIVVYNFFEKIIK